MNTEDILKFAINSDIVNIHQLSDRVMKMKKEKVLSQHPYNIWQGKDGRWRTYLFDENKKNKRKQIAKSTRAKLEQAILEDYEKNHEERVKIFQIFNDWMEFAKTEKSISRSTIDRYTNDFDKFVKNTDFAQRDITTINEQDVLKFLKNILSTGKREDCKITKKCFTNIKIVINGIFTYAKTEREIDCISIAYALQNFKMADSYFKYNIKIDSKEVYSDDEIEKISEHIIRMYVNRRINRTRELGVLFILLTGLRVGELATLKQTDEVDGKLYVQRTESKYKGDHNNTVVYIKDYPKTAESMNGIELSDSALLVWNWIKKINIINKNPSEYVFYEEPYGRLERHHFDSALRKICRECDITFKSIHKLRKTYASILFANNVEEKIVQSQMRHRDIETTHRHYVFSTRNREYKRLQLNNIDIFKIESKIKEAKEMQKNA